MHSRHGLAETTKRVPPECSSRLVDGGEVASVNADPEPKSRSEGMPWVGAQEC